MTQLWLAWAEAQHKNLQIDLQQLLDAYELVRSAMGREWLEQQERRAEAAHLTVADFHPLYRELSSSTNQAVVTVAELAKYLAEFSTDPALPAVLQDLRSNKFPSSLFELAMAYRWRKAGAQVKLQPPTPKGGVADLEAQLHQIRFVVECSVSPDEIFGEPSFRLPSLVAHTITSSVDEPVALAAKLTVREYPPGDFHGELRWTVKKLCADVLEKLHAKSDTHVSEDTGAWLLEMEAVSESTERVPGFSGWDIAFRSVDKPLAPGEPTYKVRQEKREREKARVFLKLPPDSPDPNDKILQKLKREARQLRGVPDPRVVMLDVSGIAQDIPRFQVCRRGDPEPDPACDAGHPRVGVRVAHVPRLEHSATTPVSSRLSAESREHLSAA